MKKVLLVLGAWVGYETVAHYIPLVKNVSTFVKDFAVEKIDQGVNAIKEYRHKKAA